MSSGLIISCWMINCGALPWRCFPVHVSPTIAAMVQVKFRQSCWQDCTSATSNIHRKNSQWMPSLETLKFWKKKYDKPIFKNRQRNIWNEEINYKFSISAKKNLFILIIKLNSNYFMYVKLFAEIRQRKLKWAILIACQLMCQFVDG